MKANWLTRRICINLLLLISAPVLADQDEATLRYIETNGIKLRIAEMGEGPW